ncbi:MAG: radical SAM protein [archaeon]|nr:radical SAM protein [archaeon]
MEEDLIFKKATLALGGGILLPPGFQVPVRVSRSTAGPGAGNSSFAISFGGIRVKKSISYESGEFELHEVDGRLSLTHNGEPFLDDIAIEPVVYHCPGQAFFTLDPRCGYNCAFCASPRLSKADSRCHTGDEIAKKCLDAYNEGRITAVSLTSGVFEGNVQAEVDSFVECIKAVRRVLPDIPIGIEPYAETESQVKVLKDAGADEIKLNIQAATDAIFSKVCPDLDRKTILECMGHAVRCFGRGKVTSNIIFGMGETKEELIGCMEHLCSLGVIPTVRSLHYSAYNKEPLEAAIGTPAPVTPDYMVEIARIHREVLDRNGFDTNSCSTMCLECRCCDLVPHRDL